MKRTLTTVGDLIRQEMTDPVFAAEYAAMKAAERFGQASAANMEDLERSVNEAAARGVTLKPAPNRRRRP